ncbi:MAG: hypothetical protein VX498_10730 [Myxococcota bacterium]|nr:hypothetical protein [Myxococcota bacterium]
MPFFFRRIVPTVLLTSTLLVLTGCGCQEGNDDDTATPEPAPQYDRGYYVDMALDSQDRIWLAYRNGEKTSLEVARGSGSPLEFTRWTVDGEGEVVGGLLTGNYDAGNYATIAIDSDDSPHIAHWDKDDDRLRYATKNGDDWSTFTIDEAGGTFASMGILDGSDPIVSYYADGVLKVARRSNGAWTSEVVDEGEDLDPGNGGEVTPADVGKYSDLLVAADGMVYIAYYDAAHGDLKVARGVPGNWNLSIWSSEGNVGQWPALTEHQGIIHVSYSDVGQSSQLIFGRWTGSQLETELVDDADFVGADSAHSWVGDTAVIMYHDGVNNDAKIAVQEDDGWDVTTHMNTGAVGFFNSLATDSAGRLNWACFDHTSTDIIVQRFEP